MVKIKGTYKNGAIKLEEKINATENLDVVVEFIEATKSALVKKLPTNKKAKKTINFNDFNFKATRKILKNLNSNLSDEVIDERRN